jgi:hypothetical protein
MSKVDDLRAMREARFAAGAQPRVAATPRTPTAGQPVRPVRPVSPVSQARSAEPESPEETEAQETERLCGHRSIGNKSCQRVAGHPEKNHRYK